MPRIAIDLDTETLARLQIVATRELRDPKQQAAWMLRQLLEPTVLAPQEADATSLVPDGVEVAA